MPKVDVDVLPWLSRALAPDNPGHLRLQVEFAGERLRDLLAHLAAREEAFARLVYDARAGALRDPVRVAINDDLAELKGGLDAAIGEGDCVILMAAYTGG